jgi:phage terminase large subunit
VQIDECYERFRTASDKIKLCKQLQYKWGVDSFHCDNNEPATIREFNEVGLNAIPCKKYKGSLEDGIQEHVTLIKSGYYKVVWDACPHTIDEYEMYHYPEDSGDEENVSDKPVSASDHLMTANMYCTQGTRALRQESYKNSRSSLVKKSRMDVLSESASSGGSWYEDVQDEEYQMFNPSEDLYNS